MSTSSKPTIIGLSGTNGSGKDSLGIGLERYGYYFVSGSEFLRQELRNRRLPITRDNTRMLSTEWRNKYGGGVLIEKALADWKENRPDAKGLVIASIRAKEEAKKIHELGGIIVWADADPKIRYQRIQNNLQSRGRTDEDQISFDEFIKDEEVEMHPSDDPNSTLDMASVKAQSDIFLVNDYPDVDSFVLYAAQKLSL